MDRGVVGSFVGSRTRSGCHRFHPSLSPAKPCGTGWVQPVAPDGYPSCHHPGIHQRPRQYSGAILAASRTVPLSSMAKAHRVSPPRQHDAREWQGYRAIVLVNRIDLAWQYPSPDPPIGAGDRPWLVHPCRATGIWTCNRELRRPGWAHSPSPPASVPPVPTAMEIRISSSRMGARRRHASHSNIMRSAARRRVCRFQGLGRATRGRTKRQDGRMTS
jgi:hypothetical protein